MCRMDDVRGNNPGQRQARPRVEIVDPARQRGGGRVGAWDFAALFGGGATTDLTPRPGHQSLVWVTSGEVRLSDRAGFDEHIEPGEVCVATSPEAAGSLKVQPSSDAAGVRLDAVLPAGALDALATASLEIFAPEPFALRSVTTAISGQARVLVGEMFGRSSAVQAHSPLVATHLRVAPGAEIAMTLRADFEYGLLPTAAGIAVQNTDVPAGAVAFAAAGGRTWGIRNASDAPVSAILLGGTPLEGDTVAPAGHGVQ